MARQQNPGGGGVLVVVGGALLVWWGLRKAREVFQKAVDEQVAAVARATTPPK